MSVETDLTSIKRDIQEMNRESTNIKNSLKQMKADVTKLKEANQSNFFSLVEGTALAMAINKIFKIEEEVASVSKMSKEKLHQATLARKAEEDGLRIAQEQEARAKLEAEERQCKERLEKEQQESIYAIWTRYERIVKEPDIIKKFFEIRVFIAEQKTFDISAVTNITYRDRYSEVQNCMKTVLNDAKKSMGEEKFSALSHYDDDIKELSDFAGVITPLRTSVITDFNKCINKISKHSTLIPELKFDSEKIATIRLNIQSFEKSRNIIASLLRELQKGNVCTFDVVQIVKKSLRIYNLHESVVDEVLAEKESASQALTVNDWNVFFRSVSDIFQHEATVIHFMDIYQSFLDFVAERAQNNKVDLKKLLFIETVTRNLPNFVVAETLPFHFDVPMTQKSIGFFQSMDGTYIVFLEKSLFFVDLKKQFFASSTYANVDKDFPQYHYDRLQGVLSAINQLGFVEAVLQETPQPLKPYEENYKKYLNAIQDAKKQEENRLMAIFTVCQKYILQKQRLQLVLKANTESLANADIIASSKNGRINITRRGFCFTTGIFFRRKIEISWNDFILTARASLSVSRFLGTVKFGGITIPGNKQYFTFLMEISDAISGIIIDDNLLRQVITAPIQDVSSTEQPSSVEDTTEAIAKASILQEEQKNVVTPKLPPVQEQMISAVDEMESAVKHIKEDIANTEGFIIAESKTSATEESVSTHTITYAPSCKNDVATIVCSFREKTTDEVEIETITQKNNELKRGIKDNPQSTLEQLHALYEQVKTKFPNQEILLRRVRFSIFSAHLALNQIDEAENIIEMDLNFEAQEDTVKDEHLNFKVCLYYMHLDNELRIAYEKAGLFQKACIYAACSIYDKVTNLRITERPHTVADVSTADLTRILSKLELDELASELIEFASYPAKRTPFVEQRRKVITFIKKKVKLRLSH